MSFLGFLNKKVFIIIGYLAVIAILISPLAFPAAVNADPDPASVSTPAHAPTTGTSVAGQTGSAGPTSISVPADNPATGLVPCNGPDCDYGMFIKLLQNVLNFMFVMVGFIVILIIVWQGFGFLMAQGNTTKMQQLKQSIKKALIGFVFVLSSWLIVNIIAGALLNTQAGYQNPLSQDAPQSTTN